MVRVEPHLEWKAASPVWRVRVHVDELDHSLGTSVGGWIRRQRCRIDGAAHAHEDLGRRGPSVHVQISGLDDLSHHGVVPWIGEIGKVCLSVFVETKVKWIREGKEVGPVLGRYPGEIENHNRLCEGIHRCSEGRAGVLHVRAVVFRTGRCVARAAQDSRKPHDQGNNQERLAEKNMPPASLI